MAASAPIYDLMLLLDPAATDEQRRKVLADVEALVKREGEVIGTHDWGQRQTAYEIDRRPEAEYHLLQMHAAPPLLETLQRTLRITDGVLRFRIIKLAPGTPGPPEPPAAGSHVPAPEAETHAV
ncbi:MAG TPA: 30S ribosomal protein S6 [Solirubrobacteraceae bacterium]|nr:30S ribosomal protein S6 [Solirubrobacteraceae bacterium]